MPGNLRPYRAARVPIIADLLSLSKGEPMGDPVSRIYGPRIDRFYSVLAEIRGQREVQSFLLIVGHER